MLKPILSLVVLLFCSCSQFSYVATTSKGSETVKFTTLGGSSALETAGGTRLTQNHNKSFGQGAQAATAIIGGLASASINKAKNASDALTTQQAQSQAAATAQAKIAADQAAAALAAKQAVTSEAIKAGSTTTILPITPP